MYNHWNIGTVYHDHKRNALAVLINVTPYKAKSGVYLDFRYVNSEKYIRQPASKALSRFEATQHAFDIDTVSHFETPANIETFQDDTEYMPRIDTAKVSNGETLLGGFLGILKKSDKRKRVSERYDNVIYVDFINKCRL